MKERLSQLWRQQIYSRQDTPSSVLPFIAFEGIDGSGKSTQMARLVARLQSQGISVHSTQEPTTSPIGSVIRQMMSGRIVGSHEAIAGLFVADRLDHILNPVDGMLPLLSQGMVVVSDRYYFSSYAYHAPHVDVDWVIAANSLAAKLLRPAVTIYLDVEPSVAIKRIERSRSRLQLYETLENLTLTRDAYLSAFERQRGIENIAIVDGDSDPDFVEEAIWKLIVPIVSGVV